MLIVLLTGRHYSKDVYKVDDTRIVNELESDDLYTIYTDTENGVMYM